MTTPAFKEWAVIVRALLAGEQFLDVRKGGLHEDGRHFRLEDTRFWLYPTAEHQRAELVKPAYRRWVDESIAAAPPDRGVRIEGWADVLGVATVTDAEHLATLDSRLIWTLDYATARLKWKQRDPLWVLALRVYRLREPLTVPWQEHYGGCTSWVNLDGLPDDPESLPSDPALTDESFTARMKLAENELPGRFGAPQVDEAWGGGGAPPPPPTTPRDESTTRSCGRDQSPPGSVPVRRWDSAWQSSHGCAVGIRLLAAATTHPPVRLTAAHLQSPTSIMHVWTTSFPW
jgi:hypothetical protein